jgi:uncharacterized membrane protein YozB (DUF420 family)
MSVANDRTDKRARTDFGCQLNSAVSPLSTRAKTKSFGGLVRRRGVRQIFGSWIGRGFLVLMLVGSALISAMSLQYFDFETLPAFVIEKLPLRFEALWLASLRVHVATAAVAFPLCLALMTRALQRRTVWHRWIGRVTGVLVLFALVPSGIVLSFDAKGGRIVTAGFLLSAAIVAGAMIAGVRAARRRDLVLHGRAMRHVVGQMSVAVVSRALIVGFDALGVSPDVAYVAALWGPVLASAAVVELISRRSMVWNQSSVQLVERIRRELSPLALVVRVRAFVRPLARLGR